MLGWIETHAPHHVGGRVTKIFGRIGMRRFVQGNREKYRERIDCDSLDKIIHGCEF